MFCSKMGEKWGLAQISSNEEQNYIFNMINKRTGWIGWLFFVGLTKRDGVWMDRPFGLTEPINYNITWFPGEPNNYGEIENCMVIQKKSTYVGKTGMMDMPCGNEKEENHSFICTHVDYS